MARSGKTAIYLAIMIAIAAVGVRLIAINQPFVDNWSWRQSDVAAIARNFFENGFRFAWPQIDWAGDAPGYVGTEFPILPFAVALIYKLSGVREWVGRLETLLFFVASLPFFYLLVRRIFGETVALWALFFYSFAPLNVVAGRAFIPDVPSLGLSLVGIYFFLRCLEENTWQWLIGASISISLAVLVKAPSAIIGAPLLYLAIAAVSDRRISSDRSSDGRRQPLQDRVGRLARWRELWLLGAIALLPSAAWYWHAHQIAVNYYPHHFFGAGGFQIMNLKWYTGILWRTATSGLTPVLFLLALAGMFVAPAGKYGRFFHWWLGTMLLFVLLLGYGNRHPWYQLPLVPIAAALAGLFCQRVANGLSPRPLVRLLCAVAVALLFATMSFVYARQRYAPAATDLRDLGLCLRETTPANALIIAADDGDPTVFYYAHRKGWHFLEDNGIWQGPPLDSAQAIADLEELRSRGATYMVFPLRTRWWLDYYPEFTAYLKRNAEAIAVTPGFAIYRLTRSH